MSDEIDIRGIADVTKTLYQFSDKLGDRITLLALRSGANHMLKAMRQAAPKKTGRLRRAIVVKNSRINRRRKNGKVGVFITVKAGKSRNDQKGAYYGRFVESGSKRGKTMIPGRFFVKNTFNNLKNQSAELIIKNIEQAGKQLAQRL